jgi:hypothetical protein
MRGLMTFMLIAGIGGGLFLWQKRNEQKPAPSDIRVAGQQQQPAAAKADLTPAPRGQASEYNWMKRSIDRAADVRDQARARTKEAQEP